MGNAGLDAEAGVGENREHCYRCMPDRLRQPPRPARLRVDRELAVEWNDRDDVRIEQFPTMGLVLLTANWLILRVADQTAVWVFRVASRDHGKKPRSVFFRFCFDVETPGIGWEAMYPWEKV